MLGPKKHTDLPRLFYDTFYERVCQLIDNPQTKIIFSKKNYNMIKYKYYNKHFSKLNLKLKIICKEN